MSTPIIFIEAKQSFKKSLMPLKNNGGVLKNAFSIISIFVKLIEQFKAIGPIGYKKNVYLFYFMEKVILVQILNLKIWRDIFISLSEPVVIFSVCICFINRQCNIYVFFLLEMEGFFARFNYLNVENYRYYFIFFYSIAF
jgi:hypothetical protein